MIEEIIISYSGNPKLKNDDCKKVGVLDCQNMLIWSTRSTGEHHRCDLCGATLTREYFRNS